LNQALFPDGMANKVEFAKLFKAMCSRDKPNADPTKFVQFLFRLFDADSNGKVTFQEFIVASSFILIGDDPVEHLDKIFDVFDQDHDEKISRKELQYFIDALKGSILIFNIFCKTFFFML
jgi:Ca2+-binding EF-hand superfamily protein